MKQKTLRELARDFADGRLNKGAYRKARAELLSAVISGEIKLEVIDFPPPVVPPTPQSLDKKQRSGVAQAAAITQMGYKPEPRKSPVPTEKPKQTPQNKQGSGLIRYGAVAGVVILAVVVVLLFTLSETDKKPSADNAILTPSATDATGPRPGVNADTAATETPGITAVAGELIDAFLERRNWSTSSLDEFVSQWQSLSRADRASVSGSGELSQLSNAIYKQIQGERALSAIDPESAKEKQMQLVEFAQQLGIHDARITFP